MNTISSGFFLFLCFLFSVMMADLKRFKRRGTQPYIKGKNVWDLKKAVSITSQLRMDLSQECASQCHLRKGEKFLLIIGSSPRRRLGKILYKLQEGDYLVKVTNSNKKKLRKLARRWCRKQCRKPVRIRACQASCKHFSLWWLAVD